MSVQHVGGLSDALVAEEPAHAKAARALAAVARPQKPRGGVSTGDGEPCPLVPDHGRMIITHGAERQWCPNQEHDGKWPAEGIRTEATQSFYPFPLPKEVRRA